MIGVELTLIAVQATMSLSATAALFGAYQGERSAMFVGAVGALGGLGALLLESQRYSFADADDVESGLRDAASRSTALLELRDVFGVRATPAVNPECRAAERWSKTPAF
eukprot:TRINITY_DN1867_c0_g1_i1.p1 TRINITY_DN1867_c0_g1~~TRINITY_DN1867_c0_g1_i1.p1  ORF type:complete len:109 (+),score=21.88 TRINITY_DN1867_c0_g1_i1:154-480(+)